jgi:hypothetical protein
VAAKEQFFLRIDPKRAELEELFSFLICAPGHKEYGSSTENPNLEAHSSTVLPSIQACYREVAPQPKSFGFC